MSSATQSIAAAAGPAPADFTSSATYLANLKMTAWNTTSAYYFRAPSAKELVHFPLRLASQIDHVVFRTFPRYLLQATGLIPVAAETGNLAGPATGLAGAGEVVGQVAAETSTSWTAFVSEAFQASTFKSYWGMLQYITSRWAFTCFALSLILNRINVYGASRQRIHLSWPKRLALRIIPILLFVPQIYKLTSAIRCQTSPEYSLYRHGDNDMYSPLDWSYEGGALHSLTSSLLFSQTDEQACITVGLRRVDAETRAPYGSFSLLWPTYLRLSVSHLIEILSSSLQQLPVMTEVGMSVFEHSLAFAEAETMITTTISSLAKEARAKRNATSSASLAKPTALPQDSIVASGTIMALSDAMTSMTSPHILDRVNVPVEVLLIALLSSCNALSSNILSVLGKQRKWRLINTGFWGMCFMGSFVWGISSTSMMGRPEDLDIRPVSSLLHFPTVAIVGFLPYMFVIFGILICMCIYAIALVLTAVSLGTNPSIPQPTSLKDRFVIAHDNLQAAIQLRGIQIRWYEDFYTGLLRVGFAALTAASEAVFLNEGRAVEMRQFTWLEEERLEELQAGRDHETTNFQILEEYGIPPSSPGGSDKGGRWESGYDKERKFDKKEGELKGKDSFAYPIPRSGGIGAVQRTSKFYLLFIYMRGIMFLIGGWITFGIGALLDKLGVTARPRWLRRIVGCSLKRMEHEQDNMNKHKGVIDFWSMRQGRSPMTNEDMDIEPEIRKRIKLEHVSDGGTADAVLDERMYDWWKQGGWFGTRDESGSYAPSRADEDVTSVVSMSTTASEADEREWEDEDEASGQRTPTQNTPRPTWSFSAVETRIRESTPESESIDSPLEPSTLARLLNPPDKASREEAHMLASHLSQSQSNDRIMTRSQYRRNLETERARVLLAGRLPTKAPSVSLYNPPSGPGPRPLTNNEEAEVLETLLLERRQRLNRHKTTSAQSPDQDGSDDNTPATHMCVVCQTSARTIIAWPCRCLIVCEDCRVSLALNNFGNCVTCRRQVNGFVRLFVP